MKNLNDRIKLVQTDKKEWTVTVLGCDHVFYNEKQANRFYKNMKKNLIQESNARHRDSERNEYMHFNFI